MSAEKELLHKSISEVKSNAVAGRPQSGMILNSSLFWSVNVQFLSLAMKGLKSSRGGARRRCLSSDTMKKRRCDSGLENLRQALMRVLWFGMALELCQCHHLVFLPTGGTTPLQNHCTTL